MSNHRPLDVVIHAGPPADVIPFDNLLSYDQGMRAEVTVHDTDASYSYGEYFLASDVLFQRIGSSRSSFEEVLRNVSRAYWRIPSKIPKTIGFGFVEICHVLVRDTSIMDQIVFTLTSEVVAIKRCIWEEIRAKRHLEENPLHEIAAMRYLGNDHPNIISCNEVLFDGICINVILQYCNGGDLHDRLVEANKEHGGTIRVGLPEEEVRYWFRHLLEGLSYLQSNGICHRDLSPENVMLVQSNEQGDRSLIIDMGMCFKVPHAADDGTDNAVHIAHGLVRRMVKKRGAYGKRKYMAPELYRNVDFDAYSVDIWAAGTILFFMLTGHTYDIPMNDDPIYYLMIKDMNGLIIRLIRSGFLSPSVSISAEAADLMANMLKENPRDRFSLQEIYDHPWISGFR